MNSAALPEQLVESELFGHERGAFTGADRLRRGAFETAANGTLFLDEVGELPLPAQAKLLRVLEDRQVTRLGGSRAIEITARVVAATNRDLEQEVAERPIPAGSLLPAQRAHAPRSAASRAVVRHPGAGRSPASLDRLRSSACGRRPLRPMFWRCSRRYDWRKNNVRELRNCLERMMIASDAAVIDVSDVPPEIQGEDRDDAPDP